MIAFRSLFFILVLLIIDAFAPSEFIDRFNKDLVTGVGVTIGLFFVVDMIEFVANILDR